MIRFDVKDRIMLKKKHPCGADIFRVMRTGSDIRIVCEGCSRDMTLERERLEKMIKKVLRNEADMK